ncbi:MAG TPA: signal peptide peptidase SppA [Opitutaceae bacterium]|jgi:protease-4
MKNFITSMLGSLVALIVFATAAVLLFIGFVGAIVALGHEKKTPEIASGSYLVFDLSTNITDSPPEFDLGQLSDGRSDTAQLRTLMRAIHQAAHDPKIKGMLLLGNLSPNGLGSGYAALRELRDSLGGFRAAGKPVIAYLEYATTRDYYLASAAGEVIMDPYGELIMPGLATEPMFLGGAFEKYGIGVQVAKVGKYKSYAEMFTRGDMSPEAREETQKLLDDVWGTIVGDVAKSRNLRSGSIQSIVDSQGLIKASAALRGGLVDKVAYRDQLIDSLKKETGVTSPTDSFKQVEMDRYDRTLSSPRGFGSDEVAIVYAEGDIVDGEGGPSDIGGAKFAREIRQLREDSSVKAIVLRVNSPGGSASGAETIQRELRLARKVKPVIVSMGSYAASGGYWISAYADHIFAEPSTVTGSIGVFGILPNIQKLANDHGVTFDSVKTGKFAGGLLTISRPRTPEELAIFQNSVDWMYDEFIAKVSEGRGMKPDRVREIAQGRVWSGSDAVKIGLVDEIGGLNAAVRYAAQRAGIMEHYRVTEYPTSRNLSQAIAEALGKVAPITLRLRPTGLVGQVADLAEGEVSWLQGLNDPRGVYAKMPADLVIR